MADLDDLKKNWQSQSGISQERFDQIRAKARDSADLFQATIFRRDMLETFASAVVVAGFSVGLFVAKNWIDWTGYAVTVTAALIIPMVLWRARRRLTTKGSAASFCDFVDVEVDYLQRQVRILQTVCWWYLLPLYVGLTLISIGIAVHHSSPIGIVGWVSLSVFLAICAASFVYLWWINQSARKTHLEPLLNYYVEMQAALASSDEFVARMPDPPSEFLRGELPRKPLSRRQKWIWIALTLVVTLLVLGVGWAIMEQFDSRAGMFVTTTAPVVAILMIFISGIWRRD